MPSVAGLELAGREGLPDRPRPARVRRGLADLHRRGGEPGTPLCRPAGQPQVARSRPAGPVPVRAGRARGPAPVLLRFRRIAGRRPLVHPPGDRRSRGCPARRREAEDIGLKDRDAWQAAAPTCSALEAAKAHPAPTRTGAADPPAVPAAADRHRSVRAGGQPCTIRRGQPALPIARPSHPRWRPPPLMKRRRPARSPGTYPTGRGRRAGGLNWRPFAAMLLTGLSLPLAYWTRTAIPERSRGLGPVCRHRRLDRDRFPTSRVM